MLHLLTFSPPLALNHYTSVHRQTKSFRARFYRSHFNIEPAYLYLHKNALYVAVLQVYYFKTLQDVPDPVKYFVTRWCKDKWSQMSYSFVKTGGSGEAYDIIAEDVQGKIFFAGEVSWGEKIIKKQNCKTILLS